MNPPYFSRKRFMTSREPWQENPKCLIFPSAFILRKNDTVWYFSSSMYLSMLSSQTLCRK